MTRTFPAVVAKTAAYTIKPPMDRDGTLFTNRGATGAVTFTLPAPGSALKGYAYHFLSIAAQDLTVASATVDTLIVKHDVAGDSLATTTGGEQIGSMITAICDGTSWIALGAAVGFTYTVAT